MSRDELRLRHMLEAALEARGWVVGKTLDDFKADRKLVSACLHNLMVIGEAANHLPEASQKLLAGQPLRQIIGMRNRVVHGYYNLDYQKVWAVLDKDLPSLIQSIEKALSVP